MANNKPIDKSYLVKQFKNYETEIIDKKYVAKDSVATTLEEEVTDEQVASALLAKTELDKKVDKTSIVTELSKESTDDEVVGALTAYNELQKLESANKEQFATASGNFITVNDSVDGNIVDLKLYGKSEQKQYTGKNLLDCSGLETATIYGVTFTPVYKNGMLQYINANGTASNDIAFLVSNQFSLDNGIYKLSGCTNGSDSTYRLQLWRDGIGTIRVYNDDVQFDFKQISNNVAIYIVNGATLSNVKFYPMIRLATVEDSTYEPYVGGIPSPNPDYPQEIKSVVNPVVKTCGKNLLDVNSPNLILNGYLADRNIQYSTDFNISDYIPVEPSTSYCLQPFLKIAAKYILYDKNKNYITGYELAEILDRKGIFTTTSKTRYIRVSILKSAQNKYQLELGTKATSYEPYTETTAALPYTLNAIPVSSGGNITIDSQQYIADYVDFEKKQLVRMCKKNDFSNIKSLYIKHGDSDIKDKYAYYSDNDVLPNAKNGIAICSKFITDTNIDNLYYSGIYGHFAINNNGFWFGGGDIITSVSEAINVLKSDGSYVIYALSVPEVIDLADEEVQAFRNLETYYPTTNVFVSSGQLDGYAELKYPTTDVSGLASRNESRIAELAKDTDDKFDDVNESLSVIGKCKNLLNPTLQTATQNGVTCTNNGDGTYTLNGTASSDVYIEFIRPLSLEIGKTYKIISYNNVQLSGISSFVQSINSGDKHTVWEANNNGIFTAQYEKYYSAFRVKTGITCNQTKLKPMITTDLSATYDDFVPYTGDGETLTHDVAKLNESLGHLGKRCINVLEHGIVGDGVTDNYDAIQNLINSADEGSTIFFPKGVYCISKGLVTSSKNINIVGERKGRYIANNDNPSAKFGSIIEYIGTENATMLTQGASDWYLTMSNITFYSDSCKFKDNGLADGTIPYLQYALELSDKVVNGIECIHGCQLRNVAVVGMSGYGIKPSQSQNIIECDIYSCRYGILQENNDLMIRNCYISASGTAIYCKGSKNLIASDCYMDLLTEYGIYCENYLSGNITDCYIDHSNYSAVCVKGASNNLNLDIYCGRNGIYYSGSAEEDIKNSTATTELLNMAMATAVCFNLMIESNIKIHAVKRPNDDTGTSSKKTPVFTLYIQQIKSGYIEGTQINEYIRQKANTVRPVIINANGIIKSIYKSNEYTKVGVVKKTYTPQSTHMASQIGDMWIYGNKVYIATNITDTETTWTPITA